MITAKRLKRFAPTARQDIVDALVNGEESILAAGINTPLRLAHFVAQIATETGAFTIYVESGSYTAKNLADAWDNGNWHRYFPGGRDECIAMAEQCKIDKGEALFNLVYSKRMGNGPPESGDGWRYRGRGLIQTTGRASYRRFHHEDDPEALTDPVVGLAAAVGEFVGSGCIALADADDVKAVRKKINGGINGLEACRVFLARAKPIFKAEDDPAEPWDKPKWQGFPDPKLAWVQDALNKLGNAQLEVDGRNGTNTKKAIRAFQTKHHLSVDGTAGEMETIPAIKAALGLKN